MKNNVIINNFFNNIDSEIKAYLLGFFAADGYITLDKRGNSINNRIGIQNSIDDLEVIELFKLHICKNNNITFGERSGRKRQAHLRWTSKQMFNELTELGLGLKKTLNFKFSLNSIPDNLKRHFIRGFFDGDGSFANNCLTFSTNSLEFSEELSNEIEKISPLVKTRINEFQGISCKYYTVHFSFHRQRFFVMNKIYDYLYTDSTYFLSRKKNQIYNYLNTVLISGNKYLKQCNA